MHEAGEEIDDDGGREARGVGVDEQKERPVAEHLLALGEQIPEVVLKFPHLAATAAAEGRRVHDDGVVAASAFDFAADKFQAVVGDVAHGRGGEAGESGVFLAPLHHAFGGVDVADTRARGRGGHRGGARVAEEIEHANLAAGRARVADFLGEPVPVDGLLGKESGVLEARRVDAKGERAVTDVPLLGKFLAILPLAAASFAAVIETVPVFPARLPAAARPDDLRVGAHERVRSPFLLLHAVATVDELVILPAVGDEQSGTFGNHGA